VSPFRPDRRRRGPDRFLGPKMLIFVLGAVAGLAGMATATGWLIYAAVGLLAVGLVLRLADRRRVRDSEPPAPDEPLQ
jgi:membrane protein implicated in regulation of membrane protease activity